MLVGNTEARKKEVGEIIRKALDAGKLNKAEALILRGKLGFADSFLHGRLGSLVLKKLAEHAYGKTSKLDDDLISALQAMALRLDTSGPRVVSSNLVRCWHIFTDAAYEPNTITGGLGGVLFDDSANVSSWFGVEVSEDVSITMGGKTKQSLIYVLELVASLVALRLWGRDSADSLHVCYGDNDSARFSLIRASGANEVANHFLSKYLKLEAFARVPTEANIADFPSRFQRVEALGDDASCNGTAAAMFESLLDGLVEENHI